MEKQQVREKLLNGEFKFSIDGKGTDTEVYHTGYVDVEVELNGTKIICCGFAIFKDTFGIEVLQLFGPKINGWQLEDFYYLDVPFETIKSFDVKPVTK